MNTIIKDIKEAISTDNKPKAYDTPATVTRVEGSTVWVHIAGGVDETPVKKTINAKEGDTVQVRISNGSAWLMGNATAPPTDDARANAAIIIASTAEEESKIAHDAAISALESAVEAKGSADSAKASAENASEYAARALGNLSTVQSVTETLTWITQHGTMALTQDVALDPTHVYFVQDAGGDYVVGGVTYAIVTEPDVDEIGTYYELKIDESLNNYVATHLALTNDGLYVLSDNSGYKILLSSDGMEIYDEQDNLVSTFGESITFSSSRSQYIGDSDAYIAFDSDDDSITIGGTNVTMISPVSVFLWDMELSVDERAEVNAALGLSEDTSTWVYDDLTSAEMADINTELGLSEDTSAWYTDVSVDEYKMLCDGLGIGYQFGQSVYVGMDAISLGDNFFVDDDGYLISTAGKVGGWDIGQDVLSHGVKGSANYIELSGDNGISLGNYFSISPSGVIKARRGEFAGFTLVPYSAGNDYMVSDYTIDDVTWRTWIRSAEELDVGNTWVFSAQRKLSSDSGYTGTFLAKANGEIHSSPCADDGSFSGIWFKVGNDGLFWGARTTVTSQPNIYRNPNTGEVNYTTWSSSSEKIKKQIKDISDKEISPENLYDVDIVQFQYKDDFIDKNDQRSNKNLIGFIIEDLEKKYPVAVDKADEKDSSTWAWNSAYMIPPMLKLIQEQHKEIEELKNEIAEIKAILKGGTK